MLMVIKKYVYTLYITPHRAKIKINFTNHTKKDIKLYLFLNKRHICISHVKRVPLRPGFIHYK